MLNVKPLVFGALNTVSDFKDVFPSFPSDFTVLPCASFYEVSNTTAELADDDEYLSEMVFAIDIWANTGGETSALAAETDEAMKRVGFYREFAADVNDPSSKIRHKTMRFRLIQ